MTKFIEDIEVKYIYITLKKPKKKQKKSSHVILTWPFVITKSKNTNNAFILQQKWLKLIFKM